MQKVAISEAGTGKILIMDDESMIRILVEKILQSRGYQVVCCEDGREAVKHYQTAKAKGDPFDMVIMDLIIPGGMGGDEAIGELLAFDPQVKAVVCSGFASHGIMSNYQDYGFVDHLPKPFSMDALMSVVHRHC